MMAIFLNNYIQIKINKKLKMHFDVFIILT